MAGLVAAARARDLGLHPLVLEKGDRPGGSMLISSCVVWRHRTLAEFRAECPGGDAALQALIVERLDDALDWLESFGVPVVVRDTGNPCTVGRRFDPAELTAALVRAAGEVRLSTPFAPNGPLLLATGGFSVALARRRRLALRSNPWSSGDALELARALGAAFAGDEDEFYGRLLPAAPVAEEDFVPAAQLYARFALLVDEQGREVPVDLGWSEVEAPQALARAGGRGWLVVDAAALERRVRERTIAEMIAVAAELGAAVRRASTIAELGVPQSDKLRTPPFTAVHVQAAVTHTIGGLRIDGAARVLRTDGTRIEALYAAGADAGGIATGGYASGLAAALVFGRIAAETIAAS